MCVSGGVEKDREKEKAERLSFWDCHQILINLHMKTGIRMTDISVR